MTAVASARMLYSATPRLGSGDKFDPSKLKSRLKLAVQRFRLVSQKKEALIKQRKRKLAAETNQTKKRLWSEALVRDENTAEAYDLLGLECEMLLCRAKLIESGTSIECPDEIKRYACTLIWAAPYVEVPELAEIRQQLQFRYGKGLIRIASQNVGGCVKQNIYEKLTGHAPVFDAKVCTL